MDPKAPFDLIFILAVLSASFAGSFHCVSMCGGLVMASTTGQRTSSHIIYHLFRLLGYLGVGAISGVFGHLLLSENTNLWLSIVAAIMIGLSLMSLGVKVWSGKSFLSGISHSLGSLTKRIYPKVLKWPKWTRPAAVGSLSVLLPCGWLYSFVLVAISTQTPFRASIVLFIFWMGTLPALIFGGVTLQSLLSKIQGSGRRTVAVLFVILGMFTIGSKFMNLTSLGGHSCH